MENIVSIDTAHRLKEAGFPQPEPKVGQFWYNPDYGLFVVGRRSFTDGRDRNIFYFEAGMTYQKASDTFNGCIFTPTAADILREIYPAGVRGQIGAGDMLTMALDPEKAAMVWLELHENQKQV